MRICTHCGGVKNGDAKIGEIPCVCRTKFFTADELAKQLKKAWRRKRTGAATMLLLLAAALVSLAAPIVVSVDPKPGLALVTVSGVGPGYLWVERSTNLASTNWEAFGVALNVSPETNTYTFADVISGTNPPATVFYRARYLYLKPPILPGHSVTE